MKKCILVLAFFLTWGSALSLAIDRATLTGKVTDAAGKPLEHATVIVWHAGVKKGYSTFCPGCYTDCGKRDITDVSGAFNIKGLSPDLWFELLVVRDGYTPTFVKKVDPLKGPAVASLGVRAQVDDPSRAVRGQVLDAYGAPMRDAVVEPMAVLRTRDSAAIYGMPPGLEPVAVTDEKGEFDVAYSEPATKMALMVEARAMAPKFLILPTGPERHTITVTEGALVRGRLLHDGTPAGGVEVALNPRAPGMGMAQLVTRGSYYGEIRIGTHEDGTFTITNVPAPEEWYLYAKMESIASRGATEPVPCATTQDHQEVNVGDIQIVPAYHLRGNVILSDGKPVPDGMRVTISCVRTRDNQTALLSDNGHFDFAGLAKGKYSLYASVKGYRLQNGKFEVAASIDGDVDNLPIVLDPISSP